MVNFWQKLKKPVIGLCPMDGVTDEPMRQIQSQIAKPDVVYTEFISVEGYCKKPENFQRKLTFKENERPIIVQLFGFTPECFLKTIIKIIGLGFNGIDVNMGCPAKSVVLRGGGAALIGNYEVSEKIIIKCLEAISATGRTVPLSVKTRIGCRGVSTKEWISFLSKFSLSEVTVHGRPLRQGNSGPVNWEQIIIAKEILKEKGIICLGNGGIKSLREAILKSQNYGLDGVLIGQAALGNPWVFKKSYRPTKEEVLLTIIKHGELAWNFYGEKGYPCVLKHFGRYPRGFKKCKKVKKMLLQTRNLEQLREVIVKLDQD